MPKIDARKIISAHIGDDGVKRFINGEMDYDEFNKYCSLDTRLYYKDSGILSALYITFAENGKKLCMPIAKIQQYSSGIVN